MLAMGSVLLQSNAVCFPVVSVRTKEGHKQQRLLTGTLQTVPPTIPAAELLSLGSL